MIFPHPHPRSKRQERRGTIGMNIVAMVAVVVLVVVVSEKLVSRKETTEQAHNGFRPGCCRCREQHGVLSSSFGFPLSFSPWHTAFWMECICETGRFYVQKRLELAWLLYSTMVILHIYLLSLRTVQMCTTVRVMGSKLCSVVGMS